MRPFTQTRLWLVMFLFWVDVALGQRLRVRKYRIGGTGDETYVTIIAVRNRTFEGPNDDYILLCPTKSSPPFRRRTRPDPPEGSLCLPVEYEAMSAAV